MAINIPESEKNMAEIYIIVLLNWKNEKTKYVMMNNDLGRIAQYKYAYFVLPNELLKPKKTSHKRKYSN